MNQFSSSREITLNECKQMLRDLTDGKISTQELFQDSYPDEEQKSLMNILDKQNPFVVCVSIISHFLEDDEEDTITVEKIFTPENTVIKFIFNYESPELSEDLYSIFRQFSRMNSQRTPKFDGIYSVEIGHLVDSCCYGKLLDGLGCKFLEMQFEQYGVTLKKIEKMNRVEVLTISQSEDLIDLIQYPRKLPVESIEISGFFTADLIPAFEKIDKYPNGGLLIQHYQRHLQNPDRFTNWLYSQKDFDTLILAGLSGKKDTNNWTKFLCCDTPKIGMYDPRVLILIWTFAKEQ
jgi:hypothetical protein